jgi:hypothetical protein
MQNNFKEPKTTRGCPKQQPNQTDEEHKKEVLEWVKENSEGWEEGGVDGDGVDRCWEWKGAFAPNSGGARYNNFAAHAFVFRELRGEYLGNLLRRCRNKNCVNPDHAYPAVGARTKKKEETRRVVESGGFVLKEEGRKEIVEGLKAEVTKEIEKTIKAEMKRVEREVVEGVVAKLIEVRFDEMVAKAVRGGK